MKKLLQSLLLIAAIAVVPFAATELQGGDQHAQGTIGEEIEFNAGKAVDPGTGGGVGG